MDVRTKLASWIYHVSWEISSTNYYDDTHRINIIINDSPYNATYRKT